MFVGAGEAPNSLVYHEFSSFGFLVSVQRMNAPVQFTVQESGDMIDAFNEQRRSFDLPADVHDVNVMLPLRRANSQRAKPADLPVQLPAKFELVLTSRPPKPWASRCPQSFKPSPTR
jgi:hypothetical protein